MDWLREENAPVADCLQQLLRCTQGRHFKRYDIRATMLKVRTDAYRFDTSSLEWNNNIVIAETGTLS